MIVKDSVQETITREEIVTVGCDICGKAFHPEADIFEVQEFHHIRFRGGFGSVFGDESYVECDICQRCLKNIIWEHCRIDGEATE